MTIADYICPVMFSERNWSSVSNSCCSYYVYQCAQIYNIIQLKFLFDPVSVKICIITWVIYIAYQTVG
jgi:hypothetical protein